jgi:CheY-like chemotaxis protein
MEDIPIIMLTMLDEANMGFSLGASDYLTKPINRDRLATVLARHRRNRTCQHALLVEDDSTTREMLERILTKLDMKVTVAENGAVALDRLRTEQPDMIFLDLMMPVMDGFQFLGELRAESRWKDIPVVVVTAKELTIDDRKMLNGQVGSILQKGSFSKDQLFAEVLSIARQNLTTKSGANDAAHPAG